MKYCFFPFVRMLIIMQSLIFFASHALANELHERVSITLPARDALLAKRFDDLEKLYEQYQSHSLLTSSGASKANLFDDGLGQAWSIQHPQSESLFIGMTDVANQWLKARPNSKIARFIYARSLILHGGFLRGTGYANTVPKENWELYFSYNHKALDYLLKERELLGDDLRWYVLMLSIGNNLGWEQGVMEKLLAEAESNFKEPERLHNELIGYLLPKWYGTADKLDGFIVRAANRSKTRSPDEHYARLYLAAASLEFGDDTFRETRVDWSRLKRGLETINVKYPTNWNKNMYAYFACTARDKNTTQRLLSEIGETPILSLWSWTPAYKKPPTAEQKLATCKSFAAAP